MLRSDEQIIKRVIKGHRDDFAELVRRYQPRAYHLCFRILGRHEEAEDAVQDTFLLVYRNLASCREQSRFWAWTRRIAVNVCLKKLSPEIPSDDVLEMQDMAWSHNDPVQTEIIRDLDRRVVREAISNLPDLYRTAVVLRYNEDLSYQEISELLGEPVNRVQVRIHRAKKILAERLAVIRNAV